jgi:hypothetical protein
MRFVAENTSIPVPEVYCSLVHKDRAYIVMQRIRRDPLPVVWQHLSDDSKQRVCEQLRSMVQDLRSIKRPPGMGISSCVGGSLHDSRIPRSSPRFGPFETIQDFHFWLRQEFEYEEGIQCLEDDQDCHDLKTMISMQDGPWPPPVFTHAALNPSNIIL